MGDAVWYQAGRWRGHRVMKLLCKISLSPDTCVRQSEGILSKWGGSSLIAAKFLPGISVVAAPMAGALGMSWKRFVAYDVGASLIWTIVFLAVGVVFAGQIVVVLDFMTEFGTIAAVAIAIVLATMIVYRYLRRRWMLSDRYAPRIAVNELRELIRRGESPIVIDVRSSVAMLQDGRRVPGAMVATLAQLPTTALELPRDREVVLYCNCPNEVSALRGVRILADLGHHRARALHGGLDAWLEIEAVSPLGQLPAGLGAGPARSERRCRRSPSARRARADSFGRESAGGLVRALAHGKRRFAALLFEVGSGRPAQAVPLVHARRPVAARRRVRRPRARAAASSRPRCRPPTTRPSGAPLPCRP